MVLLSPNTASRRLAIYLPALPSGGIERLYLNLAPFFLQAGYEVTFVLDRAEGVLMSNLPAGVQSFIFGRSSLRETLPRLAAYLHHAKPDILLTAQHHKSIVAILARRMALSRSRLVVTAHMPIVPLRRIDDSFKNLMIAPLMRLFLNQADRVVAVSHGLAQEIASRYYPRPVDVIYNGVITPSFQTLLDAPCPHPWLEKRGDEPIFVAAGRLDPQKDFFTLLHAFALFRKTRPGRLVIFGEGGQRPALERLAQTLGVASDVALPGFVQNIFPALGQASAFILSSAFEAFPLVLAEALACGAPVISTDCDFGPTEILENGRYGTLVPVGDAPALAQAMLDSSVDQPDDPSRMVHGRSFSVSTCAAAYVALFGQLAG